MWARNDLGDDYMLVWVRLDECESGMMFTVGRMMMLVWARNHECGSMMFTVRRMIDDVSVGQECMHECGHESGPGMI